MDLKNCSDSVDTLKTTDKFLLQHPFQWLIFADNFSAFDYVSGLLASNIIVAFSGEDQTTFTLNQGALGCHSFFKNSILS